MLAGTLASPTRRGLLSRLRGRTFRANPDFEFVLLDQLPAPEQELLKALRGDPSFFGLIRHRSAAGFTAKAVCRETAELFKLLQEPGSLPSFIAGESDLEIAIERLICDGVLQVARGSEWVSGPAAFDAELLPALEESGQALCALSLQAIKHAASLESADGSDLSYELYRYNTLPLTPQWLRRIPDGAALEEYLQIQVGGGCRRDLDQHWKRVSPEAERGAWLAWNSRKIPATRPGSTGYKLYLSPLPSHMRVAVGAWLPSITAAGAYHFKIGSNVRGLLRPDKMVAYFDEWPRLQDAAGSMAKELSGCPSQGVPFTTELDSGALISWGSDPPSETTVPDWLQRQSWRQWICYRLGAALAIAKREKSAAISNWRFALERLRLDGVDITSWAPVSTFWQAKSAPEIPPFRGNR